MKWPKPPGNGSWADWLASQPPPERAKFLATLSPAEQTELEWLWDFWARPKQLAPEGDWRAWLILAGRGFGKTRSVCEWVYGRVRLGFRRIHIVAATAADARDILVEGESGILNIGAPSERPVYEPSKRRLTFPNGAIGLLFTAEEPDRLRGPQCDAAVADELAAWKYPEAWDQLMLGLRLGSDPRVVIATTPRPTDIIRSLVKDPHTVVTRGSTYENRGNLAAAFIEQITRQYHGTRLGRQELNGEILDDNPAALWKRDDILHLPAAPGDLARVVVAIDPAASSDPKNDETGIVVAGCDRKGHGYVLADCSGHYTPAEWSAKAVELFHEWKADRIVAEVNNGGEMVEHTIKTVPRDPKRMAPPVKTVHASRGKETRAEPVAALYEQHRVHHVGSFAGLEDQMCEWDPTTHKSPDRVDALVWAITDLGLAAPPASAKPSIIYRDPDARPVGW